MYFEIIPEELDGFSFIIAKHPDSIFERELSGGRKVVGKFEGINYVGHIENDSHVFLQTIRQLNRSNYVHVQLASVCPHNLRGFDKCLQTALRGKNGSPLSKEEFFKPRNLKAKIGPYPCSFEKLQQIFEDLHITARRITPEHLEELYTDEAFMLSLETMKPMSITEFLQKIYLISFYMTIRYNLTKIEEGQIAKFVTFCKDWLEQTSFRNSIINTLCRRNKQLIGKFETDLIENLPEEEKEEKNANFQSFFSKVNLHEKRHNAILPLLSNKCNLIDLCCGEGRFIRKTRKMYPELQILGLEAHPQRAIRAQQTNKSDNVQIKHGNVLFPDIEEKWLLPDCLTLIEAIEHVPTRKKRDKLLILIRDLFQPVHFILSTPNIEYNVNFGLSPDELRHRDHAIEYTFEQFEEQVVGLLKKDYEIEYIPIEAQSLNLEDSDIQLYRKSAEVNEESTAVRITHKLTGIFAECNSEKPANLNKLKAMTELCNKLFPPNTQASFIIHAKRITARDSGYAKKLFRKIRRPYQDVYLDAVNYTVNIREIVNGLTSKQILINDKQIFYLAPTIAPVDYTEEAPDFLEHPTAVYKYYKERGIDLLTSEKKYMGSRGYVLIFKTPELAQQRGFNSPIIINSRQGYPFFNEQSFLDKIYADIQPRLEDDFVILDCEILPWSLKAKKLIQYDFKYPGECCYLSRLYGKYGSLENAEKFLKTLDIYAKEEELCIHMFQLLAKGSISNKKIQNGFYMPRIQMYNNLTQLSNQIFKPVEYDIVNLSDFSSMSSDICRWIEYCETGGEGFVYKPWRQMQHLPNGCFIQPAMKVRGREYLRLIYGVDYLESKSFETLKRRRIRNKRALALQEFELSLKILNAFLHRNNTELLKLVAGFIGMEHVANSRIDQTL